MFDFTNTAITRSGIIFSTLFYFTILLLYWKRCTKFTYIFSTKENKNIFFLVLLFSVVSWTNGDWFHYKLIINNPSVINDNASNMETFYEKLAQFVRHNYLLFRIVVWGSALALLTLSFKNYKIDRACALFLLLAVFINYFDYSRSALGIATYFAGLSILTKEKKLISILIGAGLILLAPSFHRSTTMLVFLTLIILLPVNKKTIPIIAILLVIMFTALKGYFASFMASVIESDGDLSAKASFYMTQERNAIVSGSIIGLIIGYWKYTVFYVFMICESVYMFKDSNYKVLPFSIKAIYKVCFGTFIFAILMYFFNIGHMAFYYRFLSMTYVPLIIIAVYLFKNRMMPHKVYMGMLWFGSGYLMFDFLYRSAIGQ